VVLKDIEFDTCCRGFHCNVAAGGSATITGCHMKNLFDVAYSYYGDSLVIQNNKFENIWRYGIYAFPRKNGSALDVQYNEFSSGPQIGTEAWWDPINGGRSVVAGTTLTFKTFCCNYSYGIYYGDTIISNNVIDMKGHMVPSWGICPEADMYTHTDGARLEINNNTIAIDVPPSQTDTGMDSVGFGIDIFGNSNDFVVSNNTISGTMSVGIRLVSTYPTVTIPPGVFEIPYNNQVIGNNISGSFISSNNGLDGCGIDVFSGTNNSLIDNTIVSSGASWGVQLGIPSGYEQRFAQNGEAYPKGVQGLTMTGNTISGVYSLGGVMLWTNLTGTVTDSSLVKNDYTQAILPGWPGAGCVWLDLGTQGNLVFESGGFPHGTNAKNQVLDVAALPPPDGDGSTTNRVIGHSANFLAKDVPRGIGQKIQQLTQTIGFNPNTADIARIPKPSDEDEGQGDESQG